MIELKPAQQEAVDRLETGRILCGLPGSGKSITALAYFLTKVCKGELNSREAPESPVDLYVITPAIKRNNLEWHDECSKMFLSTDPELSIGGIKVTIDSWNNIKKYKDVKGAFFIFDEQRLTGKGAWVSTFYSIAKNNQWILLSGTPGDTWMAYIPVFVANGFYKNRTEFLTRHVVFRPHVRFQQVNRYLEEGRLYRLRNRILVDMPMERHTVRHNITVQVEYDREALRNVSRTRWNPFTDAPIANVSEYTAVVRKLVNSHSSRYEAILQLLAKHKKLIVFYNYKFELEQLRQLNNLEGLVVNEHNGERHDPVPDGEWWVYLVQYSSGAEAWNCITTDTVVYYSLNYAWWVTEQAAGRIDRLNTPYTDLYYYRLKSRAGIDNAIAKCIAEKREFSASAFAGHLFN